MRLSPIELDLLQVPSPCFILDEKKLIANLEKLKYIQDQADIKILCAFKGYAMWRTFPLLRHYLAGATASSLHEAQLCDETFGTKAHLCAPIYLKEEIDAICSHASHITFNSLSQFERFYPMAQRSGLEVALRINPEYSEVETDLYNPCVPGSRLGITIDEIPEELPEGVSGLHFHTLCEQNADALQNTLKVIEQKFDSQLKQIQWLNIGGGHHFTRKDYDVDLFINLISDFKQKYMIDIIAEPGEAIGWETGYLRATVRDIVVANGIATAMLDTSFAAHMPDCLEMPYQPEVVGSATQSAQVHKYRLGGNTCLAGDFMGDYYFEEPLKIGDAIFFEDMIHYTMVKTNTFNGVQLPSIAILKSDGVFEVIREFSYIDYKNRLS